MTLNGFLIRGTAIAAAFTMAVAALAQSPPTRVRGAISAIDDKSVTIATREGGTARTTWPTIGVCCWSCR
jgi:hypothetical protein